MRERWFAKIAVILIAIAMMFTSIAPSVHAVSGHEEKENPDNKTLTVSYTEESGTGITSFESEDFSTGKVTLDSKEYDISQTYEEKADSTSGSFTSGDEEFTLHLINWEDEENHFSHVFELLPIPKYKVLYTYSGDEGDIKTVMPIDEKAYKKGEIATILQPSDTVVETGGKTYRFKGWVLNGEKFEEETIEIDEEDVTFDSEWKADTVLSGATYEYDYDKAESTGRLKPGTEVNFLMKDDEESSFKSDGEGRFDEKIDEDKEREDGKYPYNIEKDGEHLGAEGTLDSDDTNNIYIRKRYVPTSSDYKLSAQEGVENGYVKEPGTYSIEGVNGRNLSNTLDGEESKSIKVNINETGVIEDFYIYKDKLCSRVLTGETVAFDTSPPVINSVSTSPAKEGTYVKEHGIYSKKKAELFIDTEIVETGAGLDEVYIIGVEKDGKETRYDVVKQQSEDGKYKVTIALPSKKNLMNASVMYLVATDKFGNTSERKLIAKTQAGSSVTLELVAPKVSHEISISPNSNGWYKSEPTVTAKAKDETAGLEYIKIYQDGNLVKEVLYKKKVTSEQKLSVKANASIASKNGAYTFRIEARDNSGNIAEEEFSIKIDLVSPTLSIGGITEGSYYSKAPTATIGEEEKYYAAKGNKITVTIKKAGREKDAVYQTDGKNSVSIPSTEFSSDGVYTVVASAIDAAGNGAGTKTVKFTKDGTPPRVTLDPTKNANAYGWYNYKPTLITTAQDALSGLETFYLTEDGKTLAYNEYDTIMRVVQELQEKARISTESSDGSYQFIATAIDRAGNTTKKVINLKVDLVTPVLSTSGLTDGEHYISVPPLNVSVNEKHYAEQGAYLRYNIIRDNRTIVGSRSIRSVNEMTVPTKLFDTDGRYSITITAEDAAGNAAKPINYKIVRDATSPVVTLSGASDGQFYNRPVTIDLEVIERFFETNSVSTSATRTLGGTESVGFPFSSTGETSYSSKTFSDTGTYTVTASAVDKAGNSSGTKRLSFTVDQVAPEITISGVTDSAVYTYGQTVAPSVKFFDDYPGSESVSYTKGGVPIANPSFEPLKENDGLYTLTATATDKAGNTTTKTVTFTINRFGSYFIYNDAIKNLQGKAVQRVEEALIITEKNVSKVVKTDAKLFRDGKALEEKAKTSKNEEGAEKTYKHTYDASLFETEGAYEINVISKDEASNEMESKEENGPVKFFVDRTAPTISLSGIDPKGNKAESIDVEITATDLLTGVKEVKAYIDGTETHIEKAEDTDTLKFTVGTGMKQEVKVTAVDGAGNEATVTETASVSASSFKLFFNRFKMALTAIGAGLIALLGLLIGLLKKKKNEDTN